MKCVGYDYKFKKHLARSFKGMKPSSPGPSKKCKLVTKNGGPNSEEEDEGRRADTESDVSPPSKHPPVAKGVSSLLECISVMGSFFYP